MAMVGNHGDGGVVRALIPCRIMWKIIVRCPTRHTGRHAHNLDSLETLQQIASIVCSSIQPLQAYGLNGLHEGRLGPNESLQVVQHYIDKGFRAIEKLLEGYDSKYATGDDAQLGDVFLAPQIHAGINRFQIDMTNYPILARLHEAYMEIPAFQAALPQNQPDAPSS